MRGMRADGWLGQRAGRAAAGVILALVVGTGELLAGESGSPPPTLPRTQPPSAVGGRARVGLHLVRVHPGEVAATARRLAAAGSSVLGYVPDGALLVSDPAAVDGIVGMRPWTAADAITPLLAGLGSADVVGSAAQLPVVLGLVPGPGTAAAAERLAAAGAALSWVDRRARLDEIGLAVPAAYLDAVREVLAGLPGLVWADVQPPVRLRNGASAWLCQSGRADATPLFAHGIRGQGQVVGIMDTGLDVDHCFFRDDGHGLPPVNDDQGTAVDLAQRKVLAADFYWDHDWPDPGPYDWDDHGHGTHVAGSVAGDEGADGEHQSYDGMAPAARLVIQDGGFTVDHCADLPGLGCPLRNLEPVLQQAYDQGARLHSNSWGDEEDYYPYNRYTERTADVDRFCWEHKDFLVFFAAGNAGPSDGTVGSPSTGKNVVAVGATVHGDVEPMCVAQFSSRGWTRDGRIKPDVVAPGSNVVSAWTDGMIFTNQCIAFSASGTSMACPTVAGLAALVRQYFADGYYPDGEPDPERALEPSGAQVKAVLIASAVDLRDLGCSSVAPVPSQDQGWGLVQLDRALHFAGDPESIIVDDHRTGFSGGSHDPDDPVQRSLVVESDGPLKVVLVWTDPPSSSAASVNLVNDLDLVVSGADGVFVGNAFADGRSVVGGEPDRRNNVEVVWLPEAAAGRWTVTVAPHAVNFGEQDFALVVVGPVEGDEPRRGTGRVAP